MIDLEHVEQLTSEDFKSPALPEAIYEIEDQVERQAMITKCAEKARSFGLKGEFNKMMKAMREKIASIRRTLEQEQRQSAVSQAQSASMNSWVEPDTQTIYDTGRWVVSESGVMNAEGRRIAIACHYPIYIQERMQTIENGREKVLLTWKKEGQTRSITASREQMASARKIVDLAAIGLPVTSETARDLVTYLSDFEKLNPDIKNTYSTARFGWVGIESKNLDFVPYCPERVTFETTGFDDLVGSVRTKGSSEVWLNFVKRLRAAGRHEVMVYLAASFASPLVPLLKALPFVVNLYGKTGTGKTVALMVAASIWANPGEHSYITESNSTVNAITKRLGILYHLPLMLDDLSKMGGTGEKKKDKMTDLIYNICSGGGKARLDRNTNMRDVEKWANVTLTNLERPLADETMQGGAVNRVLDFETEDTEIFEDGNAVVNNLMQHYGHAGPQWISIIKEMGIENIREAYRKNEAALRKAATDTGIPKEQKQIAAAAILLTADELTEKMIFQDGLRLDFDYVFQTIKDVRTTSEMERAYLFVSDTVIQFQNKFRVTDFGDYRGDVWGEFLDGNWVAIIPTALREIADRGNFDPNQFIKWMDKNGLIRKGEGKHYAKSMRLNGIPKTTRAYVLNLGKEEDDEDDEGGSSGQTVEEPAEIAYYTPEMLDNLPFD